MIDPYLYPNTDILINKFDLKNSEILNFLEADYTSSRLKDIIQSGLEGNFDLDHLLKFHYCIFQDIYSWAGQMRTINIEKPEPALGGLSIEYSDTKNIKSDIDTALAKIKSVEWNKLNLEEKSKAFSFFLANLWKIHPFREGNTRTIITFCSHLAEKKGFPLDTDLLKDHPGYVRNALVAASAIFHDLGDRSNINYLEKIIKNAIKNGEKFGPLILF